MTPSRSTVGTIIRDVASCWKALALTDIAYKIVAFIVLTPLVGVLFRTVNDMATMSAMISRGVDGLITDKPALARTVLEQRAAMSAPERLLLDLAGVLGVTSEIGEQ